jgi:hypothetical protein
VKGGRLAVVLLAPRAVTLGVYERVEPGRLRSRGWQDVAIDGGWPAMRAAVEALVPRARARGAGRVTIALRASLRGARWPPRAADVARRLRCQYLGLTAGDELRWLFSGAVQRQRAEDGVIAELEPGGMALARYRGRVLAAATRFGLGDGLVESGLLPLGESGALLATGSLAAALCTRVNGAAKRGALTREAMARIARSRGRDARTAAALRRLMDRTGKDAAFVAPDALVAGLAAALLRVPIPGAARLSRRGPARAPSAGRGA